MVNIALLGFGVIGSGVADIISQNYELIKKHINDDINIKYIVDLRDFSGHKLEHKFIKDFKIVLGDPEISVVIEMIGGSHPAYDFSLAALNAGKNVITSNKEVVVNFGHELIAAAVQNNVRYMYEASVGGGIPIIRPLSNSLLGNEITEITGILNGTSNYILTQMERNNKSMEDALAEAQQKGFAEANPSADIDGIDTCRKICILAGLAFGKLIPQSVVMANVKGIREITTDDMKKAQADNKVIRLLGRAVKLDSGKINISVAPYAVGKDNPLANINDVYNGILVKGNACGDIMFYGQGAGSMPTASAVLSDLIDIIKNKNNKIEQINWIYDNDGVDYEPVLPFDELELVKK